MDALDTLPPGRFHLLIAPRRQLKIAASTAIARLALIAPLTVLDGGNLFDPHQVVRQVRAHTPQYLAVVERISIRRAFTCHQMLALLATACSPAGQPQALHLSRSSFVVLDLLDTFADENVPALERARLFEQCLAALRCLARGAAVLVSLTPPANPDCQVYLARLLESAGQLWRFEPPAVPIQETLF